MVKYIASLLNYYNGPFEAKRLGLAMMGLVGLPIDLWEMEELISALAKKAECVQGTMSSQEMSMCLHGLVQCRPESKATRRLMVTRHSHSHTCILAIFVILCLSLFLFLFFPSYFLYIIAYSHTLFTHNTHTAFLRTPHEKLWSHVQHGPFQRSVRPTVNAARQLQLLQRQSQWGGLEKHRHS